MPARNLALKAGVVWCDRSAANPVDGLSACGPDWRYQAPIGHGPTQMRPPASLADDRLSYRIGGCRGGMAATESAEAGAQPAKLRLRDRPRLRKSNLFVKK